jgi:flagellar hook-associated protein 3 FlgL
MISGSLVRSTIEIGRQVSLAKGIAEEQQKISLGTRLLRASDDPAAAVKVESLRKGIDGLSVIQRNIGQASSMASLAESNLATAQTILDQAMESLQAVVTGTASDSNRATAAQAIRQMAADLRALSAAKGPAGEDLFPEGTPISIPLGATSSPATIARAQAFTAEVNGHSLSIDAVLDQAADALTDPSASPRDRAAFLDFVRDSSQRMAEGRSALGAIGLGLERLSAATANREIWFKARLGEVMDTNIAESVSRITIGQLTLQAAQAVYARLGQSSLFDLLR